MRDGLHRELAAAPIADRRSPTAPSRDMKPGAHHGQSVRYAVAYPETGAKR
jgi:hypothetical protein